MKHYYCTLFDRSYMARGLTLYGTLFSHVSKDENLLFILALDDETAYLLKKLKLKGVMTVRLSDLLEADQKLREAKANRTWQEFCWTLASYFCSWIMKSDVIKEVTYLDSDLAFFSDPEPIFEELGSRSIAIIPHRLIPEKKHLEVNGIYNVGWVTFRSPKGIKCLEEWKEKCLEWCYNRQEPERFGDQKYLDYWERDHT